MTRPTVIGVDPGQTTGVALLVPGRAPEVLQCSPGLVLPVVRALTYTHGPLVLAVERFVVGARSARSSTPKAGQVTRDLIGALTDLDSVEVGGAQVTVRVVLRSAAEVKPWATDRRLDAAGLLTATKGMRHAADACRHALFAQVHDAGLPDPLSKHYPNGA